MPDRLRLRVVTEPPYPALHGRVVCLVGEVVREGGVVHGQGRTVYASELSVLHAVRELEHHLGAEL